MGIFGQSPRTIKRYVNIYRIVKSHAGFKLANSDNDYKAVLFVLGVVVGHPQVVQEFITQLIAADESLTLGEFIEQSQIDTQLLSAINRNVSDDLLLMPLEPFQRNLELVSRFSFRTLTV